MHIIYSVMFCCLLNILSVNCECDSYIECLSDFVKDFFAKNETIEHIPVKTTKDLVQVENIDLDVVNKVLSDVSILLKSELDVKQLKNRKAVYKHIHDHTKIFVKSFDIRKSNDESENNTESETDIETTTEDNLLDKSVDDKLKSEEKIKLKNKESVHDNEIPNARDEFGTFYYDIEDDNSTDYPIIDYVEYYKDTTNEDTYISTDTPASVEVNSVSEEINQRMQDIDNMIAHTLDMVKSKLNNTEILGASCNGNTSSSELVDVVYPWLASIFVKNDTSSNQFQYFCDGAILSKNALLTAARCVTFDMTVDPENLLVVLGKRSLQSMADNEKTLKVIDIYTHDNFTVKDGLATNDLAILVVEDGIVYNEFIQPSCMTDQNGTSVLDATVAWDYTGTLHPIYFEKEKSMSCVNSHKDEFTFCATYGNNVPLCPNYGGVYVTRQLDNQWYLQGIRTGDPTVRGLCFDKTVIYTSLKNHTEWINDTVENIKHLN